MSSASASHVRTRPRLIGARKTVAIIASTYNEQFVTGLIEHSRDELLTLMPTASVPLYRVPGANEIPVCAEYVASHTETDAIIALGVVIRGETDHADLVATSVFTSLHQISNNNLVPIINEVLLLDNTKQAQERCLGERINRGTEAGRAATAMTELFVKLRETYPNAKTEAG